MPDPQPGPEPQPLPEPQTPSPAPAAPASPPPRIGGFEILEKIGTGGMGAVYKARQVSLDRVVALKILPPRLEKDAEFMARFVREARATGKLSHQNVVSGIDVGQADGYWYFAMEFVEGDSVGRILKRQGRLPEARVLDIAIQVAEGLAHAHAHALVHRDVKPENILISREGIAKICDLGLARSTAGDNPGLTQDGTAVGTPSYISPEQARGQKDIDARSDIYNLGATIFHLAAGRPPFTGESAPVVMAKHITDPAPELAKTAEGVSTGLSAVVARCLQKDPGNRYRSMQELAEDLRRVRQGQAPAAAPAAPPAPAAPAATPGTSRSTTAILHAKAGMHSTSRPITIRAIVRAQEARSGSPLAIGIVIGVLAILGVAFLTLSGGNEPAGRDPREKPRPLPGTAEPAVPQPPPPPTSASDLPARLERAERYRRDKPGDLKGALARFQQLQAAARGTEYEARVSSAVAEITAKRAEAARAAAGRLAADADALAAREDFDGAIAAWQKFPPDLEDLLKSRAEQAAADLRSKAEERLTSAMDDTSLRLSADEPQEGLRALDAVKGVKYSAWDARVAALRARLVNAAGDAAGRARKKKVAAAMAAFSKYADAYVAATLAGDAAAARKSAGEANADPSLKEIAAAVQALVELDEAAQRADEALRASLAALQGKGPRDFETPTGKIRGEVVKVTAAAVQLRCQTIVGGMDTTYETSINIADLAAAEVRRHLGGFKPATPAEHLALAARALALRDLEWAEAGMAGAGNHPMAPPYRTRLSELRARVAEAAAKEAWEAIQRLASGKLTPRKSKELLDRISAFEKDHGRTAVAGLVQQDLLALKDRLSAAGAGWKAVPPAGIQVRCQGGATSSVTGDILLVQVPPGQGNLATIPLLQHTRDFRLRFDYRGDLLEMFLRKVNWHGSLLLLASPTGVVLRTYPADLPNQPSIVAQDRQTAVAAGSWHHVEISAIGNSFTCSIDGAMVCRDAKLPAVARGSAHILTWPGKNFELRNISATVLDRQTASGTAEGTVTDKGHDWIDLKEDGDDVPLRYEPPRTAAGPYDPQVLKAIQGTITLNRARLAWTFDRGPLTVTGLEIIKPPVTSGAIVGTITFKQGTCIEVTPAAGPPERFLPRWIGTGAGQGGPDPRMAAELSKYAVGDRVKVDWVYEDRKRLVGIEPAR